MDARARRKIAGHVGEAGEAAARTLLEQGGYGICACNWRPQGAQQGLELDLVARKGDTLVFVEVKTRSLPQGGGIPPLAAFTPAKQRKMVRAAQAYLAAHNLWHLPCRFDLVCVSHPPNTPPTLEHFCDVICLGHSLDSSNAAWQPW